ncbi:MAG: T9SS type A sorting domain-containing protein [Flavobacteriales bacterium]|nr:T9SS type A sorting domain-containing protein [Flavobacteriales bacterium]
MSPKFIFVLFPFLTSVLSAQITITTSDMPLLNDTVRLSIQNGVQGFNPALTGANYTWNFSSLQADMQRVDEFQSVSSTPFAYQLYFNNQIMYPNHKASYAVASPQGMGGFQQFQIEDVYNYFKNSTQKYAQVGFGATINGVPSSVQYNPVDVQYSFPLNYLNTDSSFSVWGLSIPGVGYMGQYIMREDTVDGWGELTTPFGTFINTLRVKSVIHKTDTLNFNNFGFKIPRPVETEYKWLATNGKVPILMLVKTGPIVNATYRDIFRNVTQLGIDQNNFIDQLALFPNPASDFVIAEFYSFYSGEVEIGVYSLLGEELINTHDALYTGSNKIIIPLRNISCGMYLLQIKQGKQTKVAKLQVVK